MDAWLEHHLRVADRRGLLTGPRLTRVQETAIEILMALEDRDATNALMVSLRTALAAQDGNVAAHFPEWFPAPVEDAEPDVDDPEIPWQENVTPDDDAEMAAFLAQRTGTMTGADLSHGWV